MRVRDARNAEPLLSLVREQEAREMTRVKPSRADTTEYAPATPNQALYDQFITTKEIVFGLGVAGTGKTWWSVKRACAALMSGEISTIVCTRPAIEAGGSLGYLPGTLEEKFAPYFLPVREALEQFLGSGHYTYLVEHGRIQVTPLEFLRGVTLNNTWVIADEMQNATRTQHKLLLSRFGQNCKMILNGDPEQCDLPNIGMSGLHDAWIRLRDETGVGAVHFEPNDIVRSGMCKTVILAYRRPVPESALCENRYMQTVESERAGLERMLRAS
ncbi:PhoH family protein [Roseospira marina]|nr:PhoH family protein [Roseospira marina]MBB4315485.1 phosphate starvation-inducible PhoH-like protein [Roseospira marina]MBB5088369.1 phosphate starvation-inducible PhoH-like protein [Roseospira marina]